MKIRSAAPYKGTTYCIEFEDHPNVYIGEKIVLQYELKAGMDLPEAALRDIQNSDILRKAGERALYLLSVRDHCFVELYKKLEQTYPHEISLAVCRRMAESGYVNDHRYARKLAHDLFEIKHFGIYKVKQEMKRRGLTENVIEAVTEPYLDEDEAFARLEELVKKKYERYLTDEKGVKKVRSALVRAGYSYDMINSVLREHCQNMD